MIALLLQKYGLIPVQDIPGWRALFFDRLLEDIDRRHDEFLDEMERQYIEDCRVDYGGI